MLSAIETGSPSAAAAELIEFMHKDLIHAFEYLYENPLFIHYSSFFTCRSTSSGTESSR